jgi:hypothetical protein
MGGSGEGKGAGTGNDTAPLSSCAICDVFVLTIMYYCENYGLSLRYICLELQS